jgi:hypothetical protein
MIINYTNFIIISEIEKIKKTVKSDNDAKIVGLLTHPQRIYPKTILT